MLARNCVTVSPIRSGGGCLDSDTEGGGRPGGERLDSGCIGREKPGGGRLGPASLGKGRPGGSLLGPEPLGSGRPGEILFIVGAVAGVSIPGLEKSPFNSLERVVNREAIIRLICKH